jgi:hypothetical protein
MGWGPTSNRRVFTWWDKNNSRYNDYYWDVKLLGPVSCVPSLFEGRGFRFNRPVHLYHPRHYSCLSMDTVHKRERTGVLGFILEAAKLFGIAIACLLVIGVAVVVSVKTGIVIPARWFGFLFWTGALLGFVFRQHKEDLRLGIFWLALMAVLAMHVTAFSVVLRAYQAWRMIWFMFIFTIEAPLVLVLLQKVVHQRHIRNTSRGEW